MKNNKTPCLEVFSNFAYIAKMMFKVYPEKFLYKLFVYIFYGFLGFFGNAYMLRYIVNGIQEGISISELLGYVIVICVLNIAFALIKNFIDEIIYPVIDKRSEMRIMRVIYRKSVEQDIANYENPESYERYNRAVSNGVGSLESSIGFIAMIIGIVQDISLSSWLIFTIDPVLIIFALVPALLNFYQVKVNKKRYGHQMNLKEIDRKKDYTRRSFYLSEYAKEMRLTDIGNVMKRRFTDSIGDYIKAVKTDGMRVATGSFIIGNLGPNIAKFSAYIYAVYRTLVTGTMLVGDCLVVFNSILSITMPIKSLASLYSQMYDIALNAKDLRYFLEEEPTVSQNIDGPCAEAGDIELRDVSFRYDGASEDTLKNVNITIKYGEKIAIVGHNGAGKTTLVKLLMRLYDVTSGEIKLAGRNIREYELGSLRDSYGVVFQDYRQMSMSVAENVLGRPYRKEDESLVRYSLEKAGLWGRIAETVNGIQSVMTREFDENGLVLSGGEAQKLSIASIYAKNAAVVILDEPSSALDPISENEMYDNMKRACEGKTMIFISHRLSSAVGADRIFLMDEGTVKESGTHDELMALNGIYANMFRVQAQNYTDTLAERGSKK